MRYQVLDRWIAYTLFANEVDIIDQAIKATPDNVELKKSRIHYE
jgi:hypothetical protein